MKQYALALGAFALLLLPFLTRSQITTITASGHVTIPQSEGIKRVAGTGVGGALRLETTFGKQTSGIATIEYVQYADKTTPLYRASFSTIPIQVGLKFYTNRKAYAASGFFVSGELGIMPATTKFKYANGNHSSTFKESGLSTSFGIGYGMGRGEASLRPQFNLSAAGFDVYYLNFELAFAFIKITKQSGSSTNEETTK